MAGNRVSSSFGRVRRTAGSGSTSGSSCVAFLPPLLAADAAAAGLRGLLGLRAATGAGGPFEWRLDAVSAQRFASLSLSLADRHPEAGHHYVDGDADQEITVRLSLNEYPSVFLADAG